MHRQNNDHDEFISCSMHVAINEGSSELARRTVSHATVRGARGIVPIQRVQTRRCLRSDFFLRIYMTVERYLGRLLLDPDDDNPGSNSRSRSSSSQWWWDCLVAPPSGSWLSSKLRRTCMGPDLIEARRNSRRHNILIKSTGKLPCCSMPRQALTWCLYAPPCRSTYYPWTTPLMVDLTSQTQGMRVLFNGGGKRTSAQEDQVRCFFFVLFPGWVVNRPSEPGVVGCCWIWLAKRQSTLEGR